MARVEVRFPIDELTAQVRAAAGRLIGDRQALLNQIGVQLLSFSQLAYREKARGNQGGDGIQWRPLSIKTIEARVRQRAPAKRIVAQRKELARQIKALLTQNIVKQKGKKGRKVKNSAKAKILALRRKRVELLTRLRQMVNNEFANHEIGVNTGLQRSSAMPGFQPADGQGGNIIFPMQASITVGYGRSYSVHFDRRRPLLPERIPVAWQERFDLIAERWAARILRERFNDGG